jgi:hypothetical protein
MEEILALINKGRAALGKPPLSALPKGDPDESDGCILARALGRQMGIEKSEMSNYVMFKDSSASARLWRAWNEPPVQYAQFLNRKGRLGWWWCVDVPEPLNAFITAFDRGEYPELIRKPRVRKEQQLQLAAA